MLRKKVLTLLMGSFKFAFTLRVSSATQNQIDFGGVAQLGEHLLCTQGVAGSTPVISTNFFKVWFFYNLISSEEFNTRKRDEPR